MSEERILVVDVQGFYLNNKFIVKELSISIDDSQVQTFIIKPPLQYSSLTPKEKASIDWLYNHHHGLKWKDGDSTLSNIMDYYITHVKDNNFIYYVKGLEKIKWIQNIFKDDINFYNLDDLNCPNLKTLYKNDKSINVCSYHRKYCICAEKNVILLRKFIKSNINKENIKL